MELHDAVKMHELDLFYASKQKFRNILCRYICAGLDHLCKVLGYKKDYFFSNIHIVCSICI